MKTREERPWGYYEILSDEPFDDAQGKPGHKVKRLVLHPGKRLSLQRHEKRREHWYIVQGEGLARVDDHEWSVAVGDVVDVPMHVLHRITNTGKDDLTFIEVQTGTYFGEDDIERLEDDYGRIEK